MAEHSSIEWTEATWNPIAGCSIVSPGCTNCYAMRRVAPRLAKNPATPHYAGTVEGSNAGPVWTSKVNVASDKVLTAPLRWKRPRLVFVNSTSDLFHEAVPDETIDKIFAVMALCPQHTFQILTKRSARMREWFEERWQPAPERRIAPGFVIPAETVGETRRTQIERACEPLLERLGLVDTENDDLWTADGKCKAMQWRWPLPNVWLGVSAERQKEADERIPDLLATPAAIRFVSAEPLIGPIQFDDLCDGHKFIDALRGNWWQDDPEGPNRISRGHEKLDWIIVGGESGPGARPMHPDWAREIRDECAAAQVPFFFKQWGEWAPGWTVEEPWRFESATILPDGSVREWQDAYPAARLVDPDMAGMCRSGKKAAGRLLDGREHTEWPQPQEVPAL